MGVVRWPEAWLGHGKRNWPWQLGGKGSELCWGLLENETKWSLKVPVSVPKEDRLQHGGGPGLLPR